MRGPETNDEGIYFGIAILLSLYQAYRGFRFQWLGWITPPPPDQVSRSWPPPRHPWNPLMALGKWEKVLALCIADTIFHLGCSLAGFFALWIVYLETEGRSLLAIQPGGAILLVALGAVGLLGVTGQLPYLIQAGKLPWTK